MKQQEIRLAVIRPALQALGRFDPRMNSGVAEELIILTMAQESHLGKYNTQIGGGPGMGPGQIERATHSSIWDHFIKFRPGLRSSLRELSLREFTDDTSSLAFHSQLIWNWQYSVGIMRLVYWIAKEPLPKEINIEQLAQYWDTHYNKNPTKGHPHEAVANYERFVKGK